MTELHAGLKLYRDQLHRAIAADLNAPPPLRHNTRPWLLRLALPAGALAAGTLSLSLTGGSRVQSADAAILHHVAAALTASPGMILHEKATVTASWGTAPYELWQETSPPYHYRVAKWGHQGTGSASAPEDFAAQLRALIQAGQATVEGTTTINGTPAYKLSVSGASDQFLNGTAYVAQNNYHPLEIDTTADGGERIVYQTYEYLPATSTNMTQLGATAPQDEQTAGRTARSATR